MAEIKIKKAKVIIKDKVSKNGNPYKTFSLMESYKVKDQSGNEEWVNYFWDAYFPNAESLSNKCVIENVEGFTMGGKYQERATIKVYVKDFVVTKPGEAPLDNNAEPNFGFADIPEGGDLPFAAPTR